MDVLTPEQQLPYVNPRDEQKRILRVWESNICQGLSGLPAGTTIVDYEFGIDFDGWSVDRGEIKLWQYDTDDNAFTIIFYAPGMALKIEDVWIDIEQPEPNIHIPAYDDPSWAPDQTLTPNPTLPDLTQLAPEEIPDIEKVMARRIANNGNRTSLDDVLKLHGLTRDSLKRVPDEGYVASAFGWKRGADMPSDMGQALGGIVPGEMSPTDGPYGVLCPECKIGIITGDEHSDNCSWWFVVDAGRPANRITERDNYLRADRLKLAGVPSIRTYAEDLHLPSRELANTGRSRFQRSPDEDHPGMIRLPQGRPTNPITETRLDLMVNDVTESKPRQTNPPLPTPVDPYEEAGPVTGRADLGDPVSRTMQFDRPGDETPTQVFHPMLGFPVDATPPGKTNSEGAR